MLKEWCGTLPRHSFNIFLSPSSVNTLSEVRDDCTTDDVNAELGRKIKNEIKFIWSYEHDSLLNDGH